MNPVLSALLRVALFGLGLAATCLPRAFELAVGPVLGRLLLALDRKRRCIAEENLRRCLPELGPDGRADLLRRNYEHYGTLAFELMHLFSPVPGHYRRYAERTLVLHGYDAWKAARDKGRGVLFASCHSGNWEMMVAAGGLRGMKLTMVTRRNKPEWFRAKLERARAEVFVREAYDPRTMPAVLKALRKGESVGFVIDQYAHPPAGVKTRFFGVEVDTLSAVGPLASRTGAAILPAHTRRGPDGKVHVIIEPALELREDLHDPAKVTQLLASKVEAWVRETPEQWLWVHRRFKNVVWPEMARTDGARALGR